MFIAFDNIGYGNNANFVIIAAHVFMLEFSYALGLIKHRRAGLFERNKDRHSGLFAIHVATQLSYIAALDVAGFHLKDDLCIYRLVQP